MASYSFNRTAVQRYSDRIIDRALSYVGMNVRQAIKRSLKVQRKKRPHSLPGEPPLVNTTKSPLKTRILYALDKLRKRVIIGPAIFPQRKSTGTPVPQLLERGGSATIETITYKKSTPRPRTRLVNRRGDLWANRPFYSRTTKKDRKAGVGRYTYFYTREAWERATKTPGSKLIKWFRAREKRQKKKVTIEPRPFVEVALEKYISSGGVDKALQRSIQRG